MRADRSATRPALPSIEADQDAVAPAWGMRWFAHLLGPDCAELLAAYTDYVSQTTGYVQTEHGIAAKMIEAAIRSDYVFGQWAATRGQSGAP
jgi:hypothetical protein